MFIKMNINIDTKNGVVVAKVSPEDHPSLSKLSWHVSSPTMAGTVPADEMRAFMNEVRKSLKELTDKTESLTNTATTLTDVTDKLSKQVANIGEVGYLAEIMVRSQVEKLYGTNFARSFTVQDLFGLARASLPKEVDENGMLIQYGHITTTNVDRAEKLGAVVVKNVNKFRADASRLLQDKKIEVGTVEGIIAGCVTQKMSSKQRAAKQAATLNVIEQTKYDEHCAHRNVLKAEIAHLETFLKDIEKFGAQDAKSIALLPFGLQAFSALARKDGIPITTLEFDICGSVEFNPPHVTIKVGEIKKGGGTAHRDALLQLLKRLAVVYAAVRVILDDDDSSKFWYKLIGLAFFVKGTSQGVFKSEDVDRVINQNKLRLPPVGSNLNPRETLSMTKIIL